MKSLFSIFLLFYTASASCIQSKPPPKFSATYKVSGTLYIPYAELEEPFNAWYDARAANSRIDYYGEMMRTFQVSSAGRYGTAYKVVPVTEDDRPTATRCLLAGGTLDSKVAPQSVLPDLADFKCLGDDIVEGVKCEKWRMVTTIGEKVNRYTMWVRYETDTVVPVKYEMKGYNSLLGSHYDHYFLRYNSFEPTQPAAYIFNITMNMTCTDYPTPPGASSMATFNPMREFVQGHSGHVDDAWAKFKVDHGRLYEGDADRAEHDRRKEVFRQNLRFIHSKNRANLGFQMAVNHLADRTEDELRALRGRRHAPGTTNRGLPQPPPQANLPVPDTMDWRLYGAVTPVKDQSVCGSCWSFGTTGAIEGQYFVKHKKLLRLSQQALIDCSWGEGNNGCDGGEDFRAYEFIMKKGGLPTEADYGPYYGADGYCHVDETPLQAPIKGFVNVTSGDENALRTAIFLNGPVSISIDASVKSFSFYSNGVYYDPACKNKIDELDHAVLAVGYGRMNGQNYWLVKNSWSNYWGNDGYIIMSSKDNNCGVMTAPTYVLM
uniref:Venom C1A protease 4 n=1 Tax=Lethocerus distinctifemur TaxID=280095 RepID=A0A2K8JLK6_9HEMI|nr:venom C1A protease 4 [Lethocerus distinctifemur]